MNTPTQLSVSELWNGMLDIFRLQIICAYYGRIITSGNLGVNWNLWDKTPEWVNIPKLTMGVRQALTQQLLKWVSAHYKNLPFDRIESEHFRTVLEHLHKDFNVYYHGLGIAESPNVSQFVAFVITQMEHTIKVVERARSAQEA